MSVAASLRTLLCVLSVVALVSGMPETGVAGTTGTLNGTVTQTASGAPVAGARVTATSASQTASTTTDAGGHFSFVSLAPDTYTVTVQKTDYETASYAGVSVFADQVETVRAQITRSLKTIATVTSRAASDLVKPGTTSDVYSVNAATAGAAAGLGGGGSLNSAYSALASMPGLFIPPEQQGWNQTVYIRGGRYDQIGYEYDGVPVNRSFDNYPGSTAGNLGQEELQVYPGGSTAGASATGLAGFINQVIKTGTYPGFGNADAGVGTPIFYHDLNVEAGGATPNRLFSYYAGVGGYNQQYRYLDQFNGASVQQIFGSTGPSNHTVNLPNYPGVYPTCVGSPAIQDPFATGQLTLPPGVANDPGCYSTLSPDYLSYSGISDREAVLNLHIGVPHKRDGGRDDIQILYNPVSMLSSFYSSLNDAAGIPQALYAAGELDAPGIWPDFLTWPSGTYFGEPAAGLTAIPYYFPNSPTNRCANVDPSVPGACPSGSFSYLPADYRDGFWNDASIVKVQYQKNIGSTAYARLFGYTFYSDWLQEQPIRYGTGSGFGAGYDYELNAHTRGATFQFADQFSSKHLITATVNYTTATTDRYNNTNYQNGVDANSSAVATNLTDGTNCYAYQPEANAAGTAFLYVPGQPAPCNDPTQAGTFLAPAPSVQACPTPIPGGTQPVVSCPALPTSASWRVTYTGNQGFENRVKPIFTSLGLQDQFRPNDKLNLNVTLRMDRYQFDLANTSDNGQDFWFAAARREFCYNPVTLQPVLIPQPPASGIAAPPFIGFTCPIDNSSGSPVQTVHPDGRNGHLLFSNNYGHTIVDSAFQPRLEGTYTLNSTNVLRFSAGRYSQEPADYQVQYGAKDNNLPYPLFQGFWQYGFTTPRHDPQVQYSNNFDLSWEHAFKGTDMSLKVTPYYRYATNQIYDISPGFGLGGGLNTGVQWTDGVELELTKGDFDKDGLAWQLSYTYLNARERFNNYPGTSLNPIDPYNDYIAQYNALTKGGGGAQCYVNDVNIGVGNVQPDPSCAPVAGFNPPIFNPYYSKSPQPLLDRNGWYAPGGDYPYLVPNTFSALINYKRGKFTITPAFTFNSGTNYGNPADVFGLDPRTCTNNSAGMTNSAISTTNPLQADYTSCGLAATPSGSLFIPNPDSGRFDSFNQFRQPNQFNLSMTLSYAVSPQVTVTGLLTNLVNRCWGGSKTSWSTQFPPNSYTCGYISSFYYVSNFYNGTSPNDVGANGVALNPAFAHPFIPAWADTNSLVYTMPFNAYIEVHFKV